MLSAFKRIILDKFLTVSRFCLHETVNAVFANGSQFLNTRTPIECFTIGATFIKDNKPPILDTLSSMPGDIMHQIKELLPGLGICKIDSCVQGISENGSAFINCVSETLYQDINLEVDGLGYETLLGNLFAVGLIAGTIYGVKEFVIALHRHFTALNAAQNMTNEEQLRRDQAVIVEARYHAAFQNYFAQNAAIEASEVKDKLALPAVQSAQLAADDAQRAALAIIGMQDPQKALRKVLAARTARIIAENANEVAQSKRTKRKI